MTIRLLFLVTLFVVHANCIASEEPPTDDSPGGGWHAIELTKEDVTRLTTTLTNEFNYRATVKYRVCMFTFDKVYKQKFAHGFNYQYHGLACRVDSVAGAGQCQGQVEAYQLCAIHDIRIFEPLGSVQATQVLMIDVLDGKPPSDVNNVIILKESFMSRLAIPTTDTPKPSTDAPMVVVTSAPPLPLTAAAPPTNPSVSSSNPENVESMFKSPLPSSSSTAVEQSSLPSPTPVKTSSAASAAVAAVTLLAVASGCLVACLAL